MEFVATVTLQDTFIRTSAVSTRLKSRPAWLYGSGRSYRRSDVQFAFGGCGLLVFEVGKSQMRRILLALVLALLMADATGFVSLVVPDKCQTDSATECGRDGCDTFCLRCSCCSARVVVTFVRPIESATSIVATLVAPQSQVLPDGTTREIFHVPLSLLA